MKLEFVQGEDYLIQDEFEVLSLPVSIGEKANLVDKCSRRIIYVSVIQFLNNTN